VSPTSRTITSEQVKAVIVDACSQSNHLLHILRELQQQFLHISDDAVRKVAAHLCLPASEIESGNRVLFLQFLQISTRSLQQPAQQLHQLRIQSGMRKPAASALWSNA
jgi:hypothetical protein